MNLAATGNTKDKISQLRGLGQQRRGMFRERSGYKTYFFLKLCSWEEAKIRLDVPEGHFGKVPSITARRTPSREDGQDELRVVLQEIRDYFILWKQNTLPRVTIKYS
ncbi:hypothetical protein TNCT_579391 [Trichonephila clavata]|uniref:Uncharacterized protein n=1 Tax=Trichonephila clavata TaxID=2740835 RepID=A0A8X6G4V6_TRICU|nr:hypothetical protein TNCT_579391 [Trichonephila clavata]